MDWFVLLPFFHFPFLCLFHTDVLQRIPVMFFREVWAKHEAHEARGRANTNANVNDDCDGG